MATKAIEKTEATVRRIGTPVVESAHEVWLAGLGAFSVARREGVRVINEGNKLFDRLVVEGEKLERKLRKTSDDLRKTTEKEADRVTERLTSAVRKMPAPDVLRKALHLAANEPLTYHLVPKDEGWSVRREGSDRDISVHSNKKSAMNAARGVAQAHEPSRLVVHRTDGTIQTSYSYGEAA